MRVHELQDTIKYLSFPIYYQVGTWSVFLKFFHCAKYLVWRYILRSPDGALANTTLSQSASSIHNSQPIETDLSSPGSARQIWKRHRVVKILWGQLKNISFLKHIWNWCSVVWDHCEVHQLLCWQKRPSSPRWVEKTMLEKKSYLTSLWTQVPTNDTWKVASLER